MYDYEGMEAELYDQLDELSDFEDLSFYQWFVDLVDGPILDLGCGTGRILLPFAEDGKEVVGLDGSQTMLDLCASRLESAGATAELVRGDMRDFDLGDRRFGSILVPGFSVQMLLEDVELEACFDCCRKHLREDGQLIVSTHMPWEMIWDGRESCPMEERKRVDLPEIGEQLVAFQAWQIDTHKQRLVLKNRFERWDAAGDLVSSETKEMTIRWHLPHEMMVRLGEAGFSDVSVYGDFDFEPPEPDSESLVYLARI
ncbi:class I SAM-dependent methyltransferase [Pelagicoccus sp. SDUM812002]|uniref:class I SAM-dependent methyltransferase n=1 Tax=Pelagicoccus sp. SDUM812002 TaxID=3041266 RepID=UPI0028104AC3|nr:class I SAM-dependent methyltransferase [Pelagicoccus sp. SDUM812002]MDQ8187630.1 class I SAM-dependent methyltransferase [Pelagicoccus sp. SDUM812002]